MPTLVRFFSTASAADEVKRGVANDLRGTIRHQSRQSCLDVQNVSV